jgi:Fe2+ transport system protein B
VEHIKRDFFRRVYVNRKDLLMKMTVFLIAQGWQTLSGLRGFVPNVTEFGCRVPSQMRKVHIADTTGDRKNTRVGL